MAVRLWSLLQTESPSLLGLHQIRNHTAKAAKTAEPGKTGAARPAAADGKAMTGPTEWFKKISLPHKNTEEAKATMHKISKLNFPPLNPENQSQGTLNGHKPIAASTQKTPEEAPVHIRSKAALLTATPAKKAKNIPKGIVVLELEDMPVEVEDDIFHVICPICSDVALKIRYVSHKNSTSCHFPGRPPEANTDELSCETCHQSFKSVEANDCHEPCEAASGYIPVRQDEQAHNANPIKAASTRLCNALA